MKNVPPVLDSKKPPQTSALATILSSRPAIFTLLFCVTGFLGLPLLWKSPVFTKQEKTMWSIIVTIYTMILICGTGMVVYWAYTQIRSVF
jgi:hypothetical protein